MQLGGVGLEGKEKEAFNTMKMRLAELSTQFSNNVLDATKEFSLTVDDPAKVQGVPASAKAMWAQAHVQAQKEGEMDAEKGPWRLTLDMPSYIAVMSHLPDRDLREQVYKASITRASEFSKDKNNIPIIYEMLKIKHKMAKLLGFANYAERSLASKMAPSVAAVAERSNLIAEKALPAAKKELAEILALAKQMQPTVYGDVEKLMPWDTTYFSERLKEKKFDLTEEELRPYFALPNVLQGLFGLVERIFNIPVKAALTEKRRCGILTCASLMFMTAIPISTLLPSTWIHTPDLKISEEVLGWMFVLESPKLSKRRSQLHI